MRTLSEAIVTAEAATYTDPAWWLVLAGVVLFTVVVVVACLAMRPSVPDSDRVRLPEQRRESETELQRRRDAERDARIDAEVEAFRAALDRDARQRGTR